MDHEAVVGVAQSREMAPAAQLATQIVGLSLKRCGSWLVCADGHTDSIHMTHRKEWPRPLVLEPKICSTNPSTPLNPSIFCIKKLFHIRQNDSCNLNKGLDASDNVRPNLEPYSSVCNSHYIKISKYCQSWSKNNEKNFAIAISLQKKTCP